MELTLPAKKDDAPETEDPVVESLIKEEFKTETISSSTGGTIQLESGVKIEIQANALTGNQSISIETIDPFLGENESKIADDVNGAKVSAIVRCSPSGTTFQNPVKITIPYYSDLFPDEFSVDSIIVVSFSNSKLDTIPFTIDRINKVVNAEATHFSDFILKLKDGKWRMTENPKLGFNASSNNVTLSFKSTRGYSFGNYALKLFDSSTSLYLEQVICYNVRIYRKKTGYDEFIGGKQVYKGWISTKPNTYSSYLIAQDSKAKQLSIYEYNDFPKSDNLKYIFKKTSGGSPEKPAGATNTVTFGSDKNINKAIDFKSLGTDINDDFLPMFTVDGKESNVDIIERSKLEAGEKYYLKVDIMGRGDLLNDDGWNDGQGEFESTIFTNEEIGKILEENTKSTISNVKPGNSTYKYKEAFTLSCTATDNEDGALSVQSIQWVADNITIGYGSSLKSTDFSKELSIGTHKITVYAFDAVGASDSKTFQIIITNNKPEVKILQPTDINFDFGELITFEASITDVEDANIIADRISWKSNKDGEFKKAALKFGYDKLSVGVHEITVTYTDGNGETTPAKINLVIGAKAPVVDFHPVWWNWVSGNTLKLQGKITDAGGGEITDKGFVISSLTSEPALNNNEGKQLKGAGSADFEVQFENLQYDKLYYVRAYATNGKPDYSEMRQIRTESAPTVEPPSKVTAGWFHEKQGNGIYRQDNSNDETGFVIEIAEDCKSAFVKLADAPANTTFYSHTFGTQHYYSVRIAAKKGEILSDWAEKAIVPMSPADLSAESVEGGIKLTWYDRLGHNATKVAVTRGTTSTNLTGISLVDPGISSYTDNNAIAGQNYYYQVFSQYASANGNVSRSRPSDVAGPVQYSEGPVVTNPVVSTSAATSETTSGATLNGLVNSDGGADIISRGFYWSETNSNPREADNSETVSGTTGNMAFNLTGLAPSTTYYYKAWAKNSENLTGYGEPVSFKTNAEGGSGETSTFTDTRDGKTYNTVTINGKEWMAENLAYLPKVSPPLGESYTEPYYYVYGI